MPGWWDLCPKLLIVNMCPTNHWPRQNAHHIKYHLGILHQMKDDISDKKSDTKHGCQNMGVINASV